jgi:hypothetical protein
VKSNSATTLFGKFYFIRVFVSPMIFRISRVSLDSTNRLVNTEKGTHDFREELTALKEAIFLVYSFPFYFIL